MSFAETIKLIDNYKDGSIKEIQNEIKECALFRPPELTMTHLFNQSDLDELIQLNLSWAIPYDETIKWLAQFIGKRRVLEVYAGTWLYAKLLKDENVDIVATDLNSFSYSERKSTFTDVEKLNSIDAVIKYPTDVLLMCWPPKDYSSDKMDYQCLKEFKGDYFIFIGEFDGCTGSEELMNEINRNWKLSKTEIDYWNFKCSDHVSIFERK